MTEEERAKLVEDLLLMADAHHYGPLYRRAANEIKRLEKELEVAKRNAMLDWHDALERERPND